MTHTSVAGTPGDPRVMGLPGDVRRGRRGVRLGLVACAVLLGAAAVGAWLAWHERPAPNAAASLPLPEVTVATPLQDTVAPATSFLGQFSAVDSVELRAQVGGTLTEIGFRDGQVVHKGDLLFVIDPRPFQIRLEQAAAQLQTAVSKKTLADAELWRAQQLRQTSFGTVENVDQRTADQRGAEASIAAAKAAIRDAQLDLEFSRMTAPFNGRIGAHQASVGSLVSGSRGGTTATTLLATVVSLDPIYIDFEMSESDYLTFQAARHDVGAGEPVAISLGGDGHFDLHGTLDFIDNVVDRSSGTIHARATVPNPELSLTPGQFARVQLALGRPSPALLVPAAAVIPDQSQQVVMTVGEDGKVVPKAVETGEIHRGLRIIKSGLAANDRVVINGLVRVRPGAVVKPVPSTIALAAAGDQ
jgi:membrane fusion protein, multidrug efflux system